MRNFIGALFMGLIFWGLYKSQELSDKTIHGHHWDWDKPTVESKGSERTRIIRDTIYVIGRDATLRSMGTLPNDSLEQMYDMNYQDRDPRFKNHDDDDEFTEYF